MRPSSASSVEKTTEWSDEDTGGNPFSSNGDGNPFEDEPASPGVSVAVRALYDYDGQEQDELTFKAGTWRERLWMHLETSKVFCIPVGFFVLRYRYSSFPPPSFFLQGRNLPKSEKKTIRVGAKAGLRVDKRASTLLTTWKTSSNTCITKE